MDGVNRRQVVQVEEETNDNNSNKKRENVVESVNTTVAWELNLIKV